MDITRRNLFLGSLMTGFCSLQLAAQTVSSQSYVPQQSDRPEALAGDEPGFSSIFDGKTLSGWEG
ncbi:MAG TPA: DUF1080 domain-containing protein, partial [Blastocatellia bacterium]|nr:DUF1080 domain-containing protein [Blastocatellia bacterium]